MAIKNELGISLVQDRVTLKSLTDEEKLLIFKFRTTNELEKTAIFQALDIFFKRHREEERKAMRKSLSVLLPGQP